MNKTCILPWIHLEATPNGKVKPCCMYVDELEQSDLTKSSLEEVWNSEQLNNLRTDFVNGKMPLGCKPCWDAEAGGYKSKRQRDNERFSHHLDRISQPLKKPVYLDLKLGTVCNIKCRTCSTESSFKWANDEQLIYGRVLNPNLRSYWVEEDSPFWQGLEEMLDDLEYIDFTGGEPFLIKRHVEVLKKCVERDLAKDISIHYNTNGTIMPTEEMFKLWKHFKWVEVMFSIDGVGDHFNYIRHPAKWDLVMNTFNKTKERQYLHISICHTVSMLNVYYLPEFITWFKTQGLEDHQLYLNLLHYPTYYCVSNLDNSTKQVVNKRLENVSFNQIAAIKDFINSTNDNKVDEFITMTKKIDVIRNERFEEVFPEFYEVIK